MPPRRAGQLTAMAEMRKPHIPIPANLPGIAGLWAFKPAVGGKMAEFTQQLMRGSSTLTAGERELIGAFVSSRNNTDFCVRGHSAAAAVLVDGGLKTVQAVIADPDTAPVGARMRALLIIADRVRSSGLDVTPTDIDRARAAGARDEDIHDTVLVAATFCMYNRYVDGLAATTPDGQKVYDQIGRRLARGGYAPKRLLLIFRVLKALRTAARTLRHGPARARELQITPGSGLDDAGTPRQ